MFTIIVNINFTNYKLKLFAGIICWTKIKLFADEEAGREE